jgi:hypothetical protein
VGYNHFTDRIFPTVEPRLGTFVTPDVPGIEQVTQVNPALQTFHALNHLIVGYFKKTNAGGRI